MACCGRRARATSSRERPILIGQPDGTLLRVRATIGIESIPTRAVAWVTGDGVAPLVAGGILVVVE